MALATPYRRILVANRGEVALRVMRSARALGYSTVAVHSTVDAPARHVEEADVAVCIGPAPAALSYLHIGALIDAARRTGADAVHPGYGFLAENATFASACVDAGLVFIGPRPDTIALMGDKAKAKARMREAGVPCIPGFDAEAATDEELLAAAKRIGFPVMIKARAGGGGRGMRLVAREPEFAALLASARSEASSAFGDAGVLLERALIAPRHVEIQIAADRYGAAIHFGERDCSVQRRHQKLIEEAPSPAVSAALREEMGRVAVQAAQAIGYEGLGTFEFLLDGDGRFWFMEMNTRLQVEHGVTEAVAGVDLVNLQLQLAAGEPLPWRQDEIRLRGHAVEARLCTENPAQGFAPCSGRVTLWRPPEHVRVDSALFDSCDVPPDYDSLAAKVIAHGVNRGEALRKLAAALDATVLLGVESNREFLAACLRHPVFAEGKATTGFLDECQQAVLDSNAAAQEALCAVAAVLLLQGAAPASSTPLAGLRHDTHPMAVEFSGTSETLAVTVKDGVRATVRGRHGTVELELLRVQEGSVRFAIAGVSQGAHLHRFGGTLWLQSRDATVSMRRAAGRSSGAAHPVAQHGGRVVAPMNGRVLRIAGAPGQAVAAGAAVVVLEAMKMEHGCGAAIGGSIAAVHVAQGELVKAGQLLAEVA